MLNNRDKLALRKSCPRKLSQLTEEELNVFAKIKSEIFMTQTINKVNHKNLEVKTFNWLLAFESGIEESQVVQIRKKLKTKKNNL